VFRLIARKSKLFVDFNFRCFHASMMHHKYGFVNARGDVFLARWYSRVVWYHA